MNRRELFKRIAAGAAAVGLGRGTVKATGAVPHEPPSAAASASFLVNGMEVAHTLHTIDIHADARRRRWIELRGFWSKPSEAFWKGLLGQSIAIAYFPNGQGAGAVLRQGAAELKAYRMWSHPGNVVEFRVRLKLAHWSYHVRTP